MAKKIKIGFSTIFIYKKKENLYGRCKEDKSLPTLYEAYLGIGKPLILRDYMNLLSVNLIEGAKLLEICNATLVGPTFEICFNNIYDVDKFLETTEETVKELNR